MPVSPRPVEKRQINESRTQERKRRRQIEVEYAESEAAWKGTESAEKPEVEDTLSEERVEADV